LSLSGGIYRNQRLLRRSLGKLRVAQRTLSRRYKKGAREQSRGYLRQRMVVARLHERIANQRRDYLHKVSTELIHKYDTICLEDLNIRGMMQNRKLSRSIGEVGWNQFEVYLRYKAEWYGKNLCYIGRYEPSSKR
jgi:putative transposase